MSVALKVFHYAVGGLNKNDRDSYPERSNDQQRSDDGDVDTTDSVDADAEDSTHEIEYPTPASLLTSPPRRPSDST